jgi:membrane-bound metal-dependent hydrolase YbcI (DUF457 family)
MPVTPFHLLAITPIKAIAPRKFSWSVFALVNVIIDLEPITYFLITLNPEHRFFHTSIGATLIAILAALYGRGLCEGAIKVWNDEIKSKWLIAEPNISKVSAWSGALIGAWTHLLLDSFMHDDIKPLSPFTESNVLLGTIPIATLHSICLISGLLGLIGMLLFRPKPRAYPKANQRKVRK